MEVSEDIVFNLLYWRRHQHIKALDKGQYRFKFKQDIVRYRCSHQHARELIVIEVSCPLLRLLLVVGTWLNPQTR